tara:strand:+ start:376 stop:552 length:177 start_codon:yes stop_codon:yes gene_type:complete
MLQQKPLQLNISLWLVEAAEALETGLEIQMEVPEVAELEECLQLHLYLCLEELRIQLL